MCATPHFYFIFKRGAAIAQACHASTAAMWTYKDQPDTVAYMKNIDNMHKVVLESKDETQLIDLGEKLKANGINHYLWR